MVLTFSNQTESSIVVLVQLHPYLPALTRIETHEEYVRFAVGLHSLPLTPSSSVKTWMIHSLLRVR